MSSAVGIQGFWPGWAMDGAIIWAVAGLKVPNTIVPNWDMTAETAVMHGMAMILLDFVMGI